MIPATHSSLVKYDNPVLISRSDKSKPAAAAKGAAPAPAAGTTSPTKSKLPPVDDKKAAAAQTEDILNSILPPR
jgi:hypothetical protein